CSRGRRDSVRRNSMPARLRPFIAAALCFAWTCNSSAAEEHQHGTPGAAPPDQTMGGTAAPDESDLPPLGTGPNMQTGGSGALGDYPMQRDGSGTAWQPDS